MAGFVYVIRADNGLIKIGRSCKENLRRRFQSIRTASPVPVKIVALFRPNDANEYENRLHRRFYHSRSHGEWFHPTEQLLSFVAGLRKRPEVDEFNALPIGRHPRRAKGAA